MNCYDASREVGPMRKNVVVIDDDEDVRDVIVFALESHGMKVIPFTNGREGFDGLVQSKELPGLVIVDYLMPEMDGITFINRLRSEHPERFKSLPIAVSSAMGKSDPELMKIPDLIYLHKPMDLDDLVAIAKKHCD